jgi:hypothetical protein
MRPTAVSKLIMGSAALIRLCLCVLGCFLAAYQYRYSFEVVEAQETYAFVPFRLQPFGNRIGNIAYAVTSLTRGDEVLAVNGQPFTGLAVYFGELQANQGGAKRFTVTIRSPSGAVSEADVGFPHCTCGIASRATIVKTHVLPPLLCVLIGFAVALLRPRQPLALLFLALMLCLSQLSYAPDMRTSFGGFPQIVEVRAWLDWLRTPAVAYESFCQASWSAWLLLFAAYLFRGAGRRDPVPAAWVIASPTLAVAVAWTAAAVGWSEAYRVTMSLGGFLIRNSRWLTLAGIWGTAIWAIYLNRRWGAVVALLALCAMTLLYWATLGLPTYGFVPGPDGLLEVVPVTPEWLLREPFIVATFASATSVSLSVAHLKRLSRIQVIAIAALAFATPGLCIMMVSYLWHPDFPLIAAALGLGPMAWSLARLPNPVISRAGG